MRVQNMDHSLDILIEKMISAGFSLPEEIEGCSEEEIAEVEAKFKLRLPGSYREFLRRMGKCSGGLLAGSDLYYPDLLDCRRCAESLLKREQKQFTLSPSHFVFFQHGGYQFLYFDTADANDDPPVFAFVDEYEKPRKFADSFSEWLFRTVDEGIELIAQITRKRAESDRGMNNAK